MLNKTWRSLCNCRQKRLALMRKKRPIHLYTDSLSALTTQLHWVEKWHVRATHLPLLWLRARHFLHKLCSFREMGMHHTQETTKDEGDKVCQLWRAHRWMWGGKKAIPSSYINIFSQSAQSSWPRWTEFFLRGQRPVIATLKDRTGWTGSFYSFNAY